MSRRSHPVIEELLYRGADIHRLHISMMILYTSWSVQLNSYRGHGVWWLFCSKEWCCKSIRLEFSPKVYSCLTMHRKWCISRYIGGVPMHRWDNYPLNDKEIFCCCSCNFTEKCGRSPTTTDVTRMAVENCRCRFLRMLSSINYMH